MNLEEFKLSLSDELPPIGLQDLLQAQWIEAKVDLDFAHSIVQENPRYEDSWVHTYLHWKEGDLSNTSYWYFRASITKPDNLLQQEWDNIVNTLLAKSVVKC